MRTPRSRTTLRCFLFFLLVYGALMAVWPGVCGVYAAGFRAGAEAIFGTLGSHGTVRFRALPEPEGADDTKMFVKPDRSQEWTWMKFSSRHVGYLSTAVLAGLILATPLPWSRRAWALLAGMVLLHVFVAMRIAILIVCALRVDTSGRLGLSDSFWDRMLRAGVNCISTGQAISYIVPILIWILVSLRREDLDMVLRGRRDHSVEGGASGTAAPGRGGFAHSTSRHSRVLSLRGGRTSP